jgi:eukaryotic-like serine/threonine-protein kinase
MPTLVAPARFGDYRIIEKVGEGGMAEVFRAQALAGSAKQVALKLLKPGAAQHVSDLFATEADLMGLLRHPNLVEMYEIGTHEGRLFIAMEFIDGADLRRLINACRDAGRPFPSSIAVRVLIDVLTGLAYFHQATSAIGRPLELVHGDVNPANVYVSSSGIAKLGDFGAVQMTRLASGLPEGMAMGKLHYLSPEQLESETQNGQSDLFSVGVMFYELLMGSLPFDGKNEGEVLSAIRQAKLRLPEVSREFEHIARGALARSIKDRYATAGAFAGDLVRYQLDGGLFAGPTEVAAFLREMIPS